MSRFEEQYYLVYPLLTPGATLLQADDATAERADLSARIPPGKPLRFLNDRAEEGAEGVPERLDDILFDGQSFAVRNHLRERIEEFDITGLQFYPMVYTDLSGSRHRDYWYANLYVEQRFLDARRSELLAEDDEPDPDGVYVLKYAFDEEAVSRIPEESRLIFMLADVINPGIFFHQRIVDMLQQEGAAGYEAFRVSEFEDGMELQEKD